MTINREAAEQMAARLTSAVDVVDTFKEALRLATVALQEPREVSERAPGTTGAATISTCETTGSTTQVHGMWFQRSGQPLSFVTDDGNVWADHMVTSFVPDPDTAALRTEVDRLGVALEAERTGACMSCNGTGVIDSAEHRCGFCNGRGYHVSEWETKFHQAERTIALQEARIAEYEVAKANLIRAQEIEEEARLFEQARADAAEARLARVTQVDVEQIIERWLGNGPMGNLGVGWAVAVGSAAAEVAALVAEPARKPHDLSCDLATSPCADCLQQARRG